MQPFVAALGTAFGLTSQEIADIIWLALQMQDSDGAVETITRQEAPRPAQTTDDRPLPALTDRPDSTDSDELPDRDAPTKSAELHLNQPNGNQAGFGQQLALNVPDARSLREPLSLARSLKPLLQRVVTGWSTELDEAATVERIADEQLWLPVLKPALEPWLDLALVVDESESMQIWQRTIAELQRLLSHYGVFRDVRVWGLVTDAGGEVRLRPGLGAAGRRQATRRPSELIDPSGRRLILVATDCVAAGWRSGRLLPVLKLWATSGPLAIVQMLPEWLWSRTGLGFAAAVRLQGLLPGVPNQQLVATEGALWDEVDLEAGIKVPVVTLEPEPFGAWTAMVTGKGGAWSPGFVFEPSPTTVLGEELRVGAADEDTAEQRVQRFRVTASPMARRLAGLLAAAPVISLPVVRIIQDRLLAESRQVHVAEVFLGGLLRPLAEMGVEMNPDAVQYEFWDGVREGLLESVPTGDSVNVLQEVSQFVAERLGLSLDEFAAVLRNPQQAEDQSLASQSRPFAMVTVQILRQLGGEYVQFAEELERSHQPDLQLDLMSSSSEGIFQYQVGGSLPGDSPAYVTRQADGELYDGLRAGEFCYVLSSRNMGKSSLRVRTMHRLQAEGVACVVVDLLGFGTMVTEEQWYFGIIMRIARSLGLHRQWDLNTWWSEQPPLSCVQRLSKFLEEVLLVEVAQPIAIFIDEIDSILSLEFKDDFFALIHACYNQRLEQSDYQRLTFALFGMATPGELIQDRTRTPFNIGRAIELKGFELFETQPLAQGLVGKVENPQAVLQEILAWTSGYPFLTQKLCQLVLQLPTSISIGNEKQAIAQLVRAHVVENWEAQDQPTYFQVMRNRLLFSPRNIKLLSIYQQVLQQDEIAADDTSEQMELRLCGLVTLKQRKLRISNRICEEIFNLEWVDTQLSSLRPYADDFNAWIASDRQNKLYLLRGQALQEALIWAEDKTLSTQDDQFISASQILAMQKTTIDLSSSVSTNVPTKKILILAANPKDTSKLRLDEEVRAIKQRLRLAQGRDAFVVESEWAVQAGDLQQALFDFAPQIVHFCGHGEGASGLAFENATGQMQLVGATALADLFKLFKAQVDCVVLNACYSEKQATAIAKHIPYVVGMQQAIGDRAAIAFADGFYGALGAGRSVEDAFAFGRNRIQLETIPEHLTPVLKAKRKAKAAASQPSASPPEIAPMPQSAGGEPLPTTANPTRVFISYRTKEPDMTLVQEFYEALQAAGHHVFLAGERIRLGENWSARIDQELERCDYFLLLLSPQSATSEMVTEEVRRAKQLQDMRPERKPVLLPIRVNFPFSSPLNYDLRGYLQRIQQREWKSPADTPKILAEITRLLNGGQAWDAPRETSEETEMPRSKDERPEHLPLPVSAPELEREPSGSVPLTSGLYVERSPIEADCFEEVLQPGALIRIKAPRQMGKTSLMVRILDRAKAEGCQTVGFSFQRANSEVFSNLDQLLHWFCEQVGRRCQRLTQLEARWSQKGGSKDKCYYYFLECLLEDLDTPLVVGMDEVDVVFQHPEIATDFFGLLRSFHDVARSGDVDSELWSKLRLVIVHSTEIYIPTGFSQSPVNVGLSIELPEFNARQIQELAQRYDLSWNPEQVTKLMNMIGGHPYLVRVALYQIAQKTLTLDDLLQLAPTEAGPYGDHIRRHFWNLEQYPELREAMQRVVEATKPMKINTEQAFKLRSMGLIHLTGNTATVSCDLYRRYFREHLSNS